MTVTTLYVGNLPLDLDEEGLRALFAPHGEVAGASLVTDPATGGSRGFGFVEMADQAAQAAILELDGLLLVGRTPDDGLLRVNVARNRGAKPPRRAY